VDLLKPARLCVPANVDGEDPAAPEDPTHLLCYRTRSSAPFGDLNFFTSNRFGTDDGILIHRRELCVPSFDFVPTTTTTSVPPTPVTESTSTTPTSETPPTTTTTTTTTTTSRPSTSTTAAPTTSTTTTTIPGAVCGNGIVEAGETCDDGNTAAGD